MIDRFDAWFESLPKEKQDKFMFSAMVVAASTLLLGTAAVLSFTLWMMLV